uniref:Proteasome assembly chaperone 2 n=1 Tax=Catagonus wagneri TaxID=51154 RepID=A0A8C3W676_9CETA
MARPRWFPTGTQSPTSQGTDFRRPRYLLEILTAIDLIISTLNMCEIGYVYTDYLVPVVGNNPYATAGGSSAELSINAEVYPSPAKKPVALQLRSIFVKCKSKSFSWGKSSDRTKVVLSSSHSCQHNELQFHRPPSDTLLHIPCKKVFKIGVPVVAQWLTNPNRNDDVAGSIPGLAQWVKNPALL